jgi:ribosomal protein L7Ae-like RNA K-turn-binding protein
MDNTLLGLAKKAGLLEIGDESVGIAARARKARVILSAADASDGSKRRAAGYARQYGGIHLVMPFTKQELGTVLGRGSPGMVAILDAGIAAAYVSKLAKADPDSFSEAAEKLEEEARRVRQRQKEAQQHLRNKRSGKRRTLR